MLPIVLGERRRVDRWGSLRLAKSAEREMIEPRAGMSRTRLFHFHDTIPVRDEIAKHRQEVSAFDVPFDD